MNKDMSREDFMNYILLFSNKTENVLEIQKSSNVVNFLQPGANGPEEKIEQVKKEAEMLYRYTSIGVAYKSNLVELEKLCDLILRRNRTQDIVYLLKYLREFYKGLQGQTLLNQYSS